MPSGICYIVAENLNILFSSVARRPMMKNSKDGARESTLVLKAWLVSVLVIAILGSAKQDAGNNEHSVRKLVADEHPGT